MPFEIPDDWYIEPTGESRILDQEKVATEIERLQITLRRAKVLVELVTVRQAIQAGDAAIEAAGLNPYAMNEGLATGDEPLGTWWME